MVSKAQIVSTSNEEVFPIDTLEEFDSQGNSTEVQLYQQPQIKAGNALVERFSEFFHFNVDDGISIGEGNTPCLKASKSFTDFVGLSNIYIKNETLNPTWSFKDRGTWAMMHHCRMLNENTTAVVSTGNMGNSTAAYCKRLGIKGIIIVPSHASMDKIKAATLHGAQILRVETSDFSQMKQVLNDWAPKNGLRLSSGNNPIRVEGYKTLAFELYEQFKGDLPEYVAIPSSACGNIRGVFKGFRELKQFGYIERLPKMIIVQAQGNAPLVNTLKQGALKLVPENNPKTIASAITTGNPLGGQEIIDKAIQYEWLYESVSEQEILEGQKLLAQEGYYVEPSTATISHAIKKLKDTNKIKPKERVVMVLTGGGLKDQHNVELDESKLVQINETELEKNLSKLTNS